MVRIRCNGKEYEVEHFARFAEEPPHVGVGIRPAEEAWGCLKEIKEFEVYLEDAWKRAKVKQEVDVAERTWFISELLD